MHFQRGPGAAAVGLWGPHLETCSPKDAAAPSAVSGVSTATKASLSVTPGLALKSRGLPPGHQPEPWKQLCVLPHRPAGVGDWTGEWGALPGGAGAGRWPWRGEERPPGRPHLPAGCLGLLSPCYPLPPPATAECRQLRMAGVTLLSVPASAGRSRPVGCRVRTRPVGSRLEPPSGGQAAGAAEEPSLGWWVLHANDTRSLHPELRGREGLNIPRAECCQGNRSRRPQRKQRCPGACLSTAPPTAHPWKCTARPGEQRVPGLDPTLRPVLPVSHQRLPFKFPLSPALEGGGGRAQPGPRR